MVNLKHVNEHVTSLTLAIKKWQELVTMIRGVLFFNYLVIISIYLCL